ncbi:protein kinase [Romboutsia sedimentorum]|uniref:Protein kinase n=1 Tax=Romboutsia sedimentorum TaxID=1368474 RepID=A0ABT7E963_9FIRM|nr:protein kinase [Romboutsia sedimentorum]MDK2563476.1 protein kinase [Romboutsia sedimentorum]MDK2585201.1 protein kinase [Romboutsia sedimentorum]
MNFIGNRYELLNCEDNIELNKMYKARDVYYNKKVLIKIIEHNTNICENFISNLIDESTMTHQINSPYILKIIDVGIHCTELTTLYYMVSEEWEGMPLENIIKGNYLHLNAIVSIAIQIVKALEVLDAHNMYHGDLNPSNIMIDRNYNVKICNLGTTKSNNGTNIRACNEIKYLSPHQLCINYTDIESDIFALGIVLFECIFKVLPFSECENEKQMLKNIDKGVNWIELKAINGNDKLINIVKKLLNRTQKYNNIQELIIDLSLVMYEKADIDDALIIKNSKIQNKKAGFIKNKVVLAIATLSLIFFILLSMI